MAGPTTPLMEITVPAENEDPFLGSVEAFQNGVDAWLEQCNEDLELLWLYDGSPWTYDDVTFTLSWAAPIYLFSPRTGGAITIMPGSVVGASALHIVASIQIPSRPLTGSPVCSVVLDEAKPLDPNRIFLGICSYPTLIRNHMNISEAQVMPQVVELPGGAYGVGDTSSANGKVFHSAVAASPSQVTLSAVFDTVGTRVVFARIAGGVNEEIILRPRMGGWPSDHSITYGGTRVITPTGAIVLAGPMSGVELRLANRLLYDQWVVTAVWGDVRNHLGEPVHVEKYHMPRSWSCVSTTGAGPDVDAGGAGAAMGWTPRCVVNGNGGLPIETMQNPITAVDTVVGWFEVPADQTRFYPVGKRFRVRYSTGNDTGDQDYITASAVYNGGTNRTRVTINSTTGAAYIKATIPSAVADGYLFPGWIGLTMLEQADVDFHLRVLARLAVTGCGVGRFQARLMAAQFDGGPCPMSFSATDGQWTGGGWIVLNTTMGRSPVGAPQQIVEGEGHVDLDGGHDIWFLVVQYDELVGAGPTWTEWGELAPIGAGMTDRRVAVTLTELSGA